MRPRDLAALGELFRQRGRWHDKQLVPADWVQQATVAHAARAFDGPAIGAFNPTGYGYEWWVERAGGVAAFYAWGLGGQLIEVVPARQMVIVVAADTDPAANASMVGPDDIQNLVDIIVGTVTAHPRR